MTNLAPVMQEQRRLPTSQVAVDPYVVEQGMRRSLTYFASVIAPQECVADFSPTHESIWRVLTMAIDRQDIELLQYAIGIPRGHAKTFMLKLLVVYIYLYAPHYGFVLVVCNTTKMARQFCADVMTLMRCQNLQALYGNFEKTVDKDNADISLFTYQQRKCILVPIGADSAARGMNVEFKRPEIIICDDMQSAKESDSPDVSAKMYTWFQGTLIKARSYRSAVIIYVGNMYPDKPMDPLTFDENRVYTCILRNLQLDPEWTTWIAGAILADGSPIWPEVRSLKSLLAELARDRRAGQEDVWWAEVQNDPTHKKKKVFKQDSVPLYPYNGTKQPIGSYFMIDPSLGREASDSQIVTYFEVFDERGTVMSHIWKVQSHAPTVVEFVLRKCLELKCYAVFAEGYGYQSSLIQWFEFIANNLGITGIRFQPVTRGTVGTSKNAHIVSSFGDVYAGTLILHPRCRSVYIAQANDFNLTTNKNSDDILDTGQYGTIIYRDRQDVWLFSGEQRREEKQVRRAETEADKLPAYYHAY